jgi:hypothetical protein
MDDFWPLSGCGFLTAFNRTCIVNQSTRTSGKFTDAVLKTHPASFSWLSSRRLGERNTREQATACA